MSASVEESFHESVRDHLSDLDAALIAALRSFAFYHFLQIILSISIKVLKVFYSRSIFLVDDF